MNIKARWERKLPGVPNAFVYFFNQNLLWIPWGSQREAGPKQGQSVDDWNFCCWRWCLKQGGKKGKNATVSPGFLPRIHPPAGGFRECSCSWLYLTVAGTGTADDGDLRSHPCGCHNVHCWWIHASSHSLCQEDTGTHRCQTGIMGVQRKMITADILAKFPYWREPCHFSISEGLRTEGHGWKITGVTAMSTAAEKLVDDSRYRMWKKTFLSSS